MQSTPLHQAAGNGREEAARALLAAGADAAAADCNGDTPMHRAAEGGHEALVELFLSRGQALSARNTVRNLPGAAAAARR